MEPEMIKSIEDAFDSFGTNDRSNGSEVNDDIVSIVKTLKNDFQREQYFECFSNGFDGVLKYYTDRLNKIKKISDAGNKIYIFGAESTSLSIKFLLDSRNIPFSGFLLSAGYDIKNSRMYDFNIQQKKLDSNYEEMPIFNMDQIERNKNNIIIFGAGWNAARIVIPKLQADNCEEIILL